MTEQHYSIFFRECGGLQVATKLVRHTIKLLYCSLLPLLDQAHFEMQAVCQHHRTKAAYCVMCTIPCPVQVLSMRAQYPYITSRKAAKHTALLLRQCPQLLVPLLHCSGALVNVTRSVRAFPAGPEDQ
jgi:uncharacterized membrane protein